MHKLLLYGVATEKGEVLTFLDKYPYRLWNNCRDNIRKMSGVQQLTYWQQLKSLSLNSLERRREVHHLVWRILAPGYTYITT